MPQLLVTFAPLSPLSSFPHTVRTAMARIMSGFLRAVSCMGRIMVVSCS